MIFGLYLLSWMTWSLLFSTCRFKYAPRPLNQRSDKSVHTNIGLCFVVVLILAQGKSLFGSKILRSLHISGSQPPEVPEDTPNFRGVSHETYKQCSILDQKSDFPCTRMEILTSSLGLTCKQTHDLLLRAAYSFNCGCYSLSEMCKGESKTKVWMNIQQIHVSYK